MNWFFIVKLKWQNYLIYSYNEIKPKNITIDIIMKMYDKHKNNKLSVFLLEYLDNDTNFKKTCKMFNLFYVQLAHDIGVYDFNGKSFIYIFNDFVLSNQ